MTTSLQGRTALVTGAGRGIGRAIALELARTGVSVALVARSHDELTDCAASIRELGGTAVVIPADLADPDQLARCADKKTERPANMEKNSEEWPILKEMIRDGWPASLGRPLPTASTKRGILTSKGGK
ncbi:SDR family NAD(P)-dependent oxidoreductase [Actinomadura madurae]|uniref:SDR family NAD(P)-dependent oxidoreductase n=1 Tax=Actinomadura madurae TaxID=1993 RepID=UPI002025FD83|nr:SDR family NAD(P)-dependent oxidoreductase [Actinomadura madurae]URN06283.1 SDR family NAD(P)-dependent oxidoreductase [Actinomadura madurae]